MYFRERSVKNHFRGFQDLKDAIGMTDYQVRGWRAWYHHITLTIMALHYMLDQKINAQNEIPLLSCPDIKLFLALTLREALDMLVHEEGVEAAWARHATIARSIWAAVDAWGVDGVMRQITEERV